MSFPKQTIEWKKVLIDLRQYGKVPIYYDSKQIREKAGSKGYGMIQTATELLEQINALATNRGEPFKVLIVDDEEWVRETFKDICGLSDLFHVDLANSGEVALDKVSRNSYDLVTLDLIMPDISGLEAIEKIKEVNPRLPVIIITGNATERLVKEAGLNGASKVLYKPLTIAELLSEIVDTLRRQRDDG
jgi:CheY-like chemotaxis protein